MPLNTLPVQALPLHFDNELRALLARKIFVHVQKLGFLPNIAIEIFPSNPKLLWLRRK